MWQILVVTELVSVQWKYTNMKCSWFNTCKTGERGCLTGIRSKGVGLKGFVHSPAPSSVQPSISSQTSVWFAKDDFIPASQISSSQYCCIDRNEMKYDTFQNFI